MNDKPMTRSEIIAAYVNRVVASGCNLPKPYIRDKYEILEDFHINECEIHWARHKNTYACDREFRSVIMSKLA